MTVNELTYFPLTGNYNITVGGAYTNFNVTVTCTPRVPGGFLALIENLDNGSGVGVPTALGFPPQPFTTTKGVLSEALLANDATVLGPVLTAQIPGWTGTLYYDVQFTQSSLGYQPANFSFRAPTTATTVCLTDSALAIYTYGGTTLL